MKKIVSLFFPVLIYTYIYGCRLVRIEEAPRTALDYTVISRRRYPRR